MRAIALFLLKCLCTAVTILLLAAYVTGHIRPGAHFYGLTGLMYPFMVLMAVLCIVGCLLLRCKWGWLPVLALAAGYDFLPRYAGFGRKETVHAERPEIKLMTYNVCCFSWEKNNRDNIFKYIRESEADIVCLQEALSGNLQKDIAAQLPQYPYVQTAMYTRNAQLVLLSRYKIVRHENIRFSQGSGCAMCCDLLIGTDTVRVYTLHLNSFGFSRNDKNYIDTTPLVTRNDIQWTKLKNIGAALQHGFANRSGQVDTVSAHIARSPYPVIVCGDFNDTPASYTYRKIRGKLHDAFCVSGKLLGGTFRIRGNYALRIDYLLCDKKFAVTGYESPHLGYSDHYPVICKLTFR
ncbi:MAG: endonuclease/exonuclease/phosphatase family protein [Bacteroidales bacterium]|nr:endonuclease/exonuclease/phosphatase family protein [Bacteroidales bacterium]